MDNHFQWIRIADSITWLYLRNIISAEERDRLLKEAEASIKTSKENKDGN